MLRYAWFIDFPSRKYNSYLDWKFAKVQRTWENVWTWL